MTSFLDSIHARAPLLNTLAINLSWHTAVFVAITRYGTRTLI